MLYLSCGGAFSSADKCHAGQEAVGGLQAEVKQEDLSLPMPDLLTAHSGPTLARRPILWISFCPFFVSVFLVHLHCRLLLSPVVVPAREDSPQSARKFGFMLLKRIRLGRKSGGVVASESGFCTEESAVDRTSRRHVQLRSSASSSALILLRDSRPRSKTRPLRHKRAHKCLFATRALSPSKTRQSPAAHLHDATPRCGLLYIDAAPPNDQDSLQDADFAFCGRSTFRTPVWSSPATLLDRMLQPAPRSPPSGFCRADPAAVCDLIHRQTAMRPCPFRHSL